MNTINTNTNTKIKKNIDTDTINSNLEKPKLQRSIAWNPYEINNVSTSDNKNNLSASDIKYPFSLKNKKL